jgi:protocatechuate 3,4-dioxygenase beta subunit
MQRRLVLGAVFAALGLLVLLASREEPVASRGSTAGARDSRSLPMLRALFQSTPSPSGDTRLRIRGTVRSSGGRPVPGARVLASAPVAGESLSELPCENGSRGGSILECTRGLEREQVLSLVAQRQGEAPVLSRATTAADGSFTLEGLEAGRYLLWVESAEGTGLMHDVAAGDDGVELRLGAGVRLSGRVVDEAEAPVAGALVTAIFKAHSRFFEAVSDADGRFRLGPMPPGEYSLVIAREGFLSELETFTGYEPEHELTSTLYRTRRIAGRVLLAGASVAGAEVLARPESLNEPELRTLTDAAGRFAFEGVAPLRRQLIATHGGYGAFLKVFDDAASELELARGYPEVTLELTPVSHVQGVVLDETRRPIEGARVDVTQRDGKELLWSRTLTDARGRYRLGPVRPGPVSLDVAANGFIPINRQRQVVAAGENTVDLTLTRATLVEGWVVDAAGQPLVGEPLALNTLEGPEALPGNHGRRTGPDGRFSLDAPEPGRYRLEVGGQKMAPQVLEVAAPSSQRISAERLLTVMGEVVDEAGMPLPGVRVGLWPATPDIREAELTRATTDLQGRFSLGASSEGRYRVAAVLSHDDFTRATSQEIELGKGGARVRLRLEAGRRLSGVVVDRGGQPIPEAQVRVLPTLHVEPLGCGGPPPRAITDSHGRFTFRGISGEQLVLHVWKEGYLDVSRDGVRDGFPLKPDERDVRVVLLKSAAVQGRFVRADGSPIMFFELNGQEHAHEKGRFSLPIYGAGTVQFELREPGSRAAPVRRTVTVQEEVDLDVGTITQGP